MGRRRVEPVRLPGGARLHRPVEGLGIQAERLRLRAHLVGRQQTAVAVEQRVLHRLGHQGAGGLLEAQAQALGVLALAEAEQAHEVGDRGRVVEVGRQLCVPFDAREDGVIRVGRRGAAVEIGPVDRHRAGERDQRAAQRVRPPVPGLRVPGGGAAGVPDQDGQLGGQVVGQDLHLGLGQHGLGLGLGADKVVIGGRQRRRALGIGQEAAGGPGELVPGRSGDRPVGRQRLVRRQDLLDPDRRRARRAVPQPAQVAGRVGQAVDMVDPDAVDMAIAQQLEQEPVHVIEDPLVLDPHADQVRDLEEAPVGQPVAPGTPMGQAPGLRGVKPLEQRAVLRQRGQAAAQTPDVVRLGEPRGQALGRGQALASGFQGERPTARGQREGVLVVAQQEALGIAAERELAGVQRAAERLAQLREQQLRRRPVDVEVAGVGAVAAVAQQVAPPGIVRRGGHVVRHDVEDQAQALGLQGGGEAQEALQAAELVLEAAVVGHVVAVRRAGDRLEQRRGIEVADPEAREIGREAGGAREVHALAELQPVGGARRGHRGRASLSAAVCARKPG